MTKGLASEVLGRGVEERSCVHSAGFEPTTYRGSLQIVINKNRALDYSAISTYTIMIFFKYKSKIFNDLYFLCEKGT